MVYWKNAAIRAARTFVQGFLGGLAGNLMLNNESEILYAAFIGGLSALISFLQNVIEDAPNSLGNNIPKG
jgi:predicted lipid-binding transport protein (Tim44 family)